MGGRSAQAILLGASLLVLAVGLVASTAGDARDRELAAAAATAAASGDRTTAFRAYRELALRHPDDAAVREALATATARLVAELPRATAAVQQEVVRWLAESASDDLLASSLDGCTASFPAGTFTMGSPTGRADERPERTVSLDAFRIDRYEVTNAQYARFVAATGRPSPRYWPGGTYPTGEGAHPALAVSWDDAAAYCAWTGRRLPTEAEWERACRGTSGRTYPWGDTWDPSLVNIATGPSPGTEPRPSDPAWDLLTAPQPAGTAGPRPVGSSPAGATPEGVQDLIGNAAEWVVDWYTWDGYADLPARNPIGAGPPWNHVLRGSGWLDRYGRADWVARDGRCAARDSSHAVEDVRFGFRCAADAEMATVPDAAAPGGAAEGVMGRIAAVAWGTAGKRADR